MLPTYNHRVKDCMAYPVPAFSPHTVLDEIIEIQFFASFHPWFAKGFIQICWVFINVGACRCNVLPPKAMNCVIGVDVRVFLLTSHLIYFLEVSHGINAFVGIFRKTQGSSVTKEFVSSYCSQPVWPPEFNFERFNSPFLAR